MILYSRSLVRVKAEHVPFAFFVDGFARAMNEDFVFTGYFAAAQTFACSLLAVCGCLMVCIDAGCCGQLCSNHVQSEFYRQIDAPTVVALTKRGRFPTGPVRTSSWADTWTLREAKVQQRELPMERHVRHGPSCVAVRKRPRVRPGGDP